MIYAPPEDLFISSKTRYSKVYVLINKDQKYLRAVSYLVAKNIIYNVVLCTII